MSLATVKEKKQAFSEWRVQREQELKEERRLARVRVREDFQKLLEERARDLKGLRGVSDAAPLLRDEPRWKAVESDRERAELFSAWAADREKREAEERREKFRARVEGEGYASDGG